MVCEGKGHGESPTETLCVSLETRVCFSVKKQDTKLVTMSLATPSASVTETVFGTARD